MTNTIEHPVGEDALIARLESSIDQLLSLTERLDKVADEQDARIANAAARVKALEAEVTAAESD